MGTGADVSRQEQAELILLGGTVARYKGTALVVVTDIEEAQGP